MFRMFAIAAALALALPSLAAAQQKDEHKGGPPHPAAHPGGPPHPPGPPHGPIAGPPHPPGPPHGPIAGPPHPPGPPHGPIAGPPHPPGPPHGPIAGPPHPPGPPHGPIAGPPHPPGPPPGGPHLSYHGHPINRIHVNPFVYPSGWAYREWAIGAILPPLFLAREYWYADWAALGFPPPPPGDEWVRYGPDLLLVDVTTGQVIDVAYGVFY